MSRTSLACFLSLAAAAQGLLVGGAAGRPIVARPAQSRPGPAFMESAEDKEFAEWVRAKKIASGVDPDEDFAAGRNVEAGIFQVGGIIAIVVPVVAALWAYNEGYLTPQ